MNKYLIGLIIVMLISGCNNSGMNLEGRWNGPCQAYYDLSFIQDTINFEGKTYTETKSLYSDSSCSNLEKDLSLGDEDFSMTGNSIVVENTGEFIIGNSISKSKELSVIEIDFTTLYRYSRRGKPEDCEGHRNQDIHPCLIFNIFSTDGVTLNFGIPEHFNGDYLDLSKPDYRPTKINFSYNLRKVK